MPLHGCPPLGGLCLAHSRPLAPTGPANAADLLDHWWSTDRRLRLESQFAPDADGAVDAAAPPIRERVDDDQPVSRASQFSACLHDRAAECGGTCHLYAQEDRMQNGREPELRARAAGAPPYAAGHHPPPGQLRPLPHG